MGIEQCKDNAEIYNYIQNNYLIDCLSGHFDYNLIPYEYDEDGIYFYNGKKCKYRRFFGMSTSYIKDAISKLEKENLSYAQIMSVGKIFIVYRK